MLPISWARLIAGRPSTEFQPGGCRLDSQFPDTRSPRVSRLEAWRAMGIARVMVGEYSMKSAI